MKGICFTEPLFHATIEGRKTMTRRLVKSKTGYFNVCSKDGVVTEIWQTDANGWTGDDLIPVKPRYKVGDIVYLKEPYHVFDEENKLCLYRFSPKEEWLTDEEHASIVESVESLKGWKNKLSMPAWAARYFIKITAVRAERLQEISDRDCLREGVQKIVGRVIGYPFGVPFDYSSGYANYTTPREAFAALIDKINGKGAWESNPWVFAYEYELHNKE